MMNDVKFAQAALCLAAAVLLGGCATALERAERGCERGDGMQCFNAGATYDYGKPVDAQGNPIGNDRPKAAVLYRRGCDELGNSLSCTNLGMLYSEGVDGEYGFEPSPRLAFEYFDKACEMQGGDEFGCANAGGLYMEGRGVRRDFAKARSYLEVGCEYGVPQACSRLGELYRKGQGVRKNQTTAKTYDEWACYFGGGEYCPQ